MILLFLEHGDPSNLPHYRSYWERCRHNWIPLSRPILWQLFLDHLLFTDFACVPEYTRVPPCASAFEFVVWTFWWVPVIAYGFHLTFSLLEMIAHPFICPSWRTGTFGPFPLIFLFPSNFECLLVSDWERDLLFSLPFLRASCLKLHGSPREHCPFQVHWLLSLSLLHYCDLWLISSWVSFPSNCPWGDPSSLRVLKFLSLIFCST